MIMAQLDTILEEVSTAMEISYFKKLKKQPESMWIQVVQIN